MQHYNYDLAESTSFLDHFTGKGTSDYTDVSDGTGTFRIRSNGRIEVLSGYSNVGTIYAPGTAVYDQMLKNLNTGANTLKIQAVLGTAALNESLSAPTLISSSGAAPASMEEAMATPIPFYQQPWFLPTAIGLVTAAVIGGIVYNAKK